MGKVEIREGHRTGRKRGVRGRGVRGGQRGRLRGSCVVLFRVLWEGGKEGTSVDNEKNKAQSPSLRHLPSDLCHS